MYCRKVGELIQKLRKERGWTQKYLADKMNISDRTVSKWERGLGLPDVGLLKNLSDIFGIDLGKMLDGDLNERETDGGNMKKVKFYFCPVCGNLVTAASGADVICCGRKLEPMIENGIDEKHLAEVKIIDGEYYISFGHKMEKEHYINYVLCTDMTGLWLSDCIPNRAERLEFRGFPAQKFIWCAAETGFLGLCN